MAECAIFAYRENPRWRRLPYCISNNVSISGAEYGQRLQGGFQSAHIREH